jgi:hypothetical protein
MAVQEGTFSLAGVQLLSGPNAAQGRGGFEVPEDLKVGLETWMSAHRIPQSDPKSAPKIITQQFGVFPTLISFAGWWIGPNAETQSRAFMAQQQQQAQVLFAVGSRSWNVVIKNYKETLHQDLEIQYEIELEPILELGGNLPSGSDLTTAAQMTQMQYQNLAQWQTDPVAQGDPNWPQLQLPGG